MSVPECRLDGVVPGSLGLTAHCGNAVVVSKFGACLLPLLICGFLRRKDVLGGRMEDPVSAVCVLQEAAEYSGLLL